MEVRKLLCNCTRQRPFVDYTAIIPYCPVPLCLVRRAQICSDVTYLNSSWPKDASPLQYISSLLLWQLTTLLTTVS